MRNYGKTAIKMSLFFNVSSMIYSQNSLSVVFRGASQWETKRHTGTEHYKPNRCAFCCTNRNNKNDHFRQGLIKIRREQFSLLLRLFTLNQWHLCKQMEQKQNKNRRQLALISVKIVRLVQFMLAWEICYFYKITLHPAAKCYDIASSLRS